MGQWISGKDYAIGAAKRIGILVGATVGFPFLVYAVIGVFGARGVGGAAGALALVLGLYLKPLIYLLFTASMFRISIRRARAVGITAVIGMCVTLLLLSDLAFGITFGSFWAVGFTLGILSTPMPTSIATALITIVTLSLLNEFDETPADGGLEKAYTIWKSLLFLSVALGLVRLLPYVSLWLFGNMSVAITVLRGLGYLQSWLLYPYSLILSFTAASIVLVVVSRRPPEAGSRPSASPTPGNQAPMFGQRSR